VSANDWIWITEADVVSTLDIGDAIRAVRAGFADEARGDAQNMVKTHTAWDGSTLHAIGAAFPRVGLVGTKTWSHTAGGATPLLLLFDAANGELVAIAEAFALGQLRTASVSGVATDLLAVPGAAQLAMIGTGKQALAQVAAIRAVRPIQQVRVHGRDEARRKAFALRVEQSLGVEAVPAASVAEAVDGADVITLATRATEPVLTSSMVAPGAHINALGAITKERQEFEPELLERCGVIGADSVPQVRRLSLEFSRYFDEGGRDWDRVQPLSSLLEELGGRPGDADLTLTKAMGTGVCDLAVGIACYQAMRDNGLGSPRDQPSPIEPRLRARTGVAGVGYV
jgi:ornithine cyclodeaminase